jgi:outer membrane biosynthesis protein TonB
MYRQPSRMRIAVLIAIAIHAAVLFLVHPIKQRESDAEPGDRIDVTLAPGAVATKSSPAKISRVRNPTAAPARAATQSPSPAPATAVTHLAKAGAATSSQQPEQTPVMTAQTNEPSAPTNPAASPQAQVGTPGGGLPGEGAVGVESVDRDSGGGNDRAGADDAAAILSYVNRLTRAMRRLPRGAYGSLLRRKVRVQIALDRGAPSVQILGSSDVREFDRLSVAAADRALVAVKPPAELFDKRFRFSVCVEFNAEPDENFADDDARAGKFGPDGVLDLYFEHGVRCETAVDNQDHEAEKDPPLPPELAHYRDQLAAEVKRFWFYPSAAHQRGQPGLEGTIAVQIASEGGVPLARASYSAVNRYPELNDAAEVIARRAIAAVALPAELQGKPFRFEVSIEFKPVDL